MRYFVEMEIAAPRETVLALFLDPENLAQWQPSLVSFQQLSGEGMRGVGTQSEQLHRMGKREVEMLVTVTADQYPDFFAATFEAQDMWNLIENRFTELGEGRTRWQVMSELRSSSLFMKMMFVLFPGMFKKQTRLFMGYFKAFVEGARTG